MSHSGEPRDKFSESVLRHQKSLVGVLNYPPETQFTYLKKPENKEVEKGLTRTPILIISPTGEQHILKKYDVHTTAGNQRKVAKILTENNMYPKILVEGRTFMVEEFLGPKYIDMAKLGSADEHKMLEISIGYFSKMAALGIDHGDTHWMDELRVNSDTGEVKIVDIGTCRLRQDINLHSEKGSHDYLEIADYLQERIPGLFLQLKHRNPQEFDNALAQLHNSGLDDNDLHFLIHVFGSICTGLKHHFESNGTSGWEWLQSNYKKILNPLLSGYINEKARIQV